MQRSKRKCNQELAQQSSSKQRGKSKPGKVCKMTKTKKEAKVNNSEVFHHEFVSVKIEPEEKLDIICFSYCRCCFKMLEAYETGDPIDSHQLLNLLKDITQLNLQSSNFASNFCYECVNEIHRFSDFRSLTIAKQNKFLEIIQNENIEELKELYEMNFEENSKPEVKLETNENLMIIKDEFNAETTSNATKIGKVKRASKNIARSTCPLCSSKVNNLDRHMLRCQSLKCEYCDFKGANKYKLNKHIKNVHAKPIKRKSESSICPECGKVLKGGVQDHIKAFHQNIKNFYCDFCEYGTYTRTTFVRHMLAHHLPKTLKCNDCEYTAANEVMLNLHWDRCHEESKTKLVCSLCNLTFKRQSSLVDHIKRKHDKIKNFHCDICDYESYTKTEMEYHKLNKHSMNRDHMCDKCGKNFATNRMLYVHVKNVHGERRFQCEKCKKDFLNKSRLQRHVERVHIRLKRFVCDACGKGFSDPKRLFTHKMGHAGIRFPCFIPGCQSSFTRKDAAVFHIKHNHSLTALEENDCKEKLDEFCFNLKKN
ncbi:CLUMA_CG007923, isoform A [Clunio marinus]|uniref:CLUMA_CG007923, isoform A n=1 Tax=Clunio marinus TaxID=568069 RepID=A0A1J1I270_9DIPT|nr:CLUMA_CG007923, isoform A [Clunio marinus]